MTTFKSQQQGMTLIEVIVAISIGLILMALVAAGFNMYQTYQTNSITAEWLKTWQAGAQQWINDNSATLAASGGGSATQATLDAAGYFGPGFAAQNSYGETGTLKVVIGPGGRLDGLVCAAGGVPPTGLQQRQIAGMVGIAGGWVSTTAPTIAVGKGWGPVNLSTYGIPSGGCQLVVALFVANLANTDDALHRHATPGQPQLNQMSTAIDLNNNNLNNAATVNAKLLNLPAGNSVNIGGSYLYGDASNLATRSPSGGLYIQTTSGASGNIFQVHNINGDAGSTFTAQYVSASTGLWSGSYVNTNGSMLAGGNINSNADIIANGSVYASNWFRSYGNTGWYNQTYGGGWYMQDPTWIRAYGDKNIYTGGQVQAGQIQSNGRMYIKEYAEIDSSVAPGAGCSPDGLISKASDGTGMLQCKGGIWVSMGGISRMVNVYGPSVCSYGSGGGSSTTMCPAGYRAVSAGHKLLYFNNGGNWWMSNNGPDSQYILDTGNGAFMQMGGSAGYTCVQQVVTCAQ
jgi:prepilin-type N-terminal cleavage/methylation domain-containing protein